MRKIIIYYFTIITIVSCNKTKITNISVKELNNDEINNSYLTGVKIKKNLDKLILMAYESENLKYQSSDSNIVKRKKIVEKKIIEAKSKKIYNPLLKLELSRFNLNLPKEEFISRMKILQYPKIKEQVFNQKKYGINYNFYLENKSLEIIEEVKFEVLVNLIFDNSEVVFKDYFNKIEIIRPGQSIIINRDLIYNYLSNYKNIYFELHQPQKTILKIKAISFNKVGFKSEVIKEKVIK